MSKLNTVDFLGVSLVLIALLVARVPFGYLPVILVTLTGAMMAIMTMTRKRLDDEKKQGY